MLNFNPNTKIIKSLQIAIKSGRYPNVSLINGDNWLQLNSFVSTIIGCLVCKNHQIYGCTCVWHTKIKNKTYLDWHEIGDFQNLINKETVLMVMEKLLHSPYYDRRVLILTINGVECLNKPAATCLLKFLEEVKTELYCFLLTTSRCKVLPTIISRAIIIDLPKDQQLTTSHYPEILFKKWINLLVKINSGIRVIIEAKDIMKLNYFQIKEFIFALFSYLKINFPNLLSSNLATITLACWERLEWSQLNFNKKIIIYKWVNALNYLGSS